MNFLQEDIFSEICAHKAQTGINLIAQALKELEISRQRSPEEIETLANARKYLQSVRIFIGVVVLGDAKRRELDS
jgi:hypothetical protein